jgi:hypothetical protein
MIAETQNIDSDSESSLSEFSQISALVQLKITQNAYQRMHVKCPTLADYDP